MRANVQPHDCAAELAAVAFPLFEFVALGFLFAVCLFPRFVAFFGSVAGLLDGFCDVFSVFSPLGERAPSSAEGDGEGSGACEGRA